MSRSIKEIKQQSIVKDTDTYKLKQNDKIVHKGVTYDLEEREAQHQKQFPKSKIEKIGEIKTREKALEWERKQDTKYTITPQNKLR